MSLTIQRLSKTLNQQKPTFPIRFKIKKKMKTKKPQVLRPKFQAEHKLKETDGFPRSEWDRER